MGKRRKGNRKSGPAEVSVKLTESFLAEDVFLRMLRLERKRSERSGKPFLLMLLEVEGLTRMGQAKAGLQAVDRALHTAARETDLIGWHVENSVIGVIFTEIGGEKDGTVNVVRRKTEDALRAYLSPELAATVRMKFHLFPDQWQASDPAEPFPKALYSDVPEKDQSKTLFLAAKRWFDILGSLMAMVLFAPVFVAAALAIKGTSKGPILFRQERLGQYGVPFKCLKFRTMYVDNDPHMHREFVSKFISGQVQGNGNDKVFKITQDPRTTRVGRFLRKTSLDELPQFWNVLKGEMSLVGPRPPIPYELEVYDAWHRRRILEAKPGVTGLWQVEGRSRTTFDEMVRMDLRYARTQSLWQDLVILLKTPWAVLSSKGAF